MHAANCNVLTMMQCVLCLRNKHNQRTMICPQIVCVDIEVEYFCDNIIYNSPTSVQYYVFLYLQCTKSSMELVWKYRRLSSIFYAEISIPFSISYHALSSGFNAAFNACVAVIYRGVFVCFDVFCYFRN